MKLQMTFFRHAPFPPGTASHSLLMASLRTKIRVTAVDQTEEKNN